MTDNLQPLINLGIAGCVLAWFMFRLENIIKANTSSNDRLAKANLMVLLRINDLGALEKEEINKLFDDIKVSEGSK